MSDNDIIWDDRESSAARPGAIDSHVHFWHYDKKRYNWITKEMKELHQDYLPKQLELTLKRNGVKGVVAVQADQTEVETLFLQELSKTHSFIKGVVGWVDLTDNNIHNRLQYFSQFPIIKGWRHFIQSERDDFFSNASFQNGISALESFGYSFDLLIHSSQLKSTIDFVQKFPNQKFVVNHFAKPNVKEKQLDDWKMMINELAQSPNVVCKLSGLFTEAHWKKWSAGDFYPYLDIVYDCFGTSRLMYGSDWPVILLSGMYVQWKSLLEKYMEHFSKEDTHKVFSENASLFYGLEK